MKITKDKVELVNKWQKDTEETPEKVWHLVCEEGCRSYHCRIGVARKINGKWQNSNYNWCKDKVGHWRDLPNKPIREIKE